MKTYNTYSKIIILCSILCLVTQPSICQQNGAFDMASLAYSPLANTMGTTLSSTATDDQSNIYLNINSGGIGVAHFGDTTVTNTSAIKRLHAIMQTNIQGQVAWTTIIAGNTSDFRVNKMDVHGNTVYIFGASRDTVWVDDTLFNATQDSILFLIQLDLNGNLVDFNSHCLGLGNILNASIDQGGNVICQTFLGPSNCITGAISRRIIRFKKDMSILWMSPPMLNQNESAAWRSTTDSDNNIYFCGFYGDSAIFDAVVHTPVSGYYGAGFIVKLDSMGNEIWFKQSTGVINFSLIEAHGSQVVIYGNLLSSAVSFENAVFNSGEDAIVAKFSSNGNLTGIKELGSNSNYIYRPALLIHNDTVYLKCTSSSLIVGDSQNHSFNIPFGPWLLTLDHNFDIIRLDTTRIFEDHYNDGVEKFCFLYGSGNVRKFGGVFRPNPTLALPYVHYRDGLLLPPLYYASSYFLSSEPVNYVSGKVFLDVNSNNILDAGEYRLPHWNLDINGNSISTNSVDTIFFTSVSVGTFVLTPACPIAYNCSPSSDTFIYNSFGNIDTNVNFAIKPSATYNDIGITLQSNASLRLNRPLFVNLTVTNNGTSAADAVIRLSMDTAIASVTQPNLTDSIINGNQFYYSLTNILPLRYKTISVAIAATSLQVLGDTATIESVVISSLSDSVSSNDTMENDIVVVAAYDPNQKSASKMTIQYDEYVEDKGLNYHVQFQNTGNAEAFNVWVRDTLLATLNPQSLKMIASSHSCSHKLHGNILEVSFPDINLPDSTTDPAGSIGWFTFQTSMSDGLNVLDAVENRVGIYFDQNPVVLTEHAITLIINNEEFPQGITTTFQPQANVFPNPASDEITVKVNDFSGHDQLSLHDVQGRVIGQWSMNSSEQTISIEGVAPGLYFLSVGSQSADPVKVMIR